MRVTMGMETYRELLFKVSTECEKIPPYTSLSSYNVFRVLQVHEKEEVMCRFLADLLDPEGTHGCGILFLKSFVHDVLKRSRA